MNISLVSTKILFVLLKNSINPYIYFSQYSSLYNPNTPCIFLQHNGWTLNYKYHANLKKVTNITYGKHFPYTSSTMMQMHKTVRKIFFHEHILSSFMQKTSIVIIIKEDIFARHEQAYL
jgi:hypothetical protein